LSCFETWSYIYFAPFKQLLETRFDLFVE